MNDDSQSGHATRTSGSWFLPLAFTGFGLYIVAIALGVVPFDQSQIHVPRWLLVLAGAAFALGGWMPRLDLDSRAFRFVVAGVVMCMLALLNWALLHPEFGVAHAPMTPRPGLVVRLAAPGPVLRAVYAIVLDVALVAMALWFLFGRRRGTKPPP